MEDMSAKISFCQLQLRTQLKALLLLGIVFVVITFLPINVQPRKSMVSMNIANAALVFNAYGIPLCGHLPDPRCVLSDVSPVCQADLASSKTPPNCTEDDKIILKLVASCDPSRGFFSSFTDVGTGFGCSDVQKQQSSQAAEMYANTVTS